MVWQDQDPPATDVILHLNVPCAGGAPAYLEIDKRFAEPATSRRWCGTPMRWARADRSTTWCTPSGRCRGWVEVGLRRGRAAVVKRIWSENGPRRSMSKGAKAMVAACMFPEKEKGGRGKKASVTEGFSGVSSYKMLSEARTVIALAPDLVDEVKKGQRSLADAYKTAPPSKSNER